MSRSKIIPGHDYEYDHRGYRINPNRKQQVQFSIGLSPELKAEIDDYLSDKSKSRNQWIIDLIKKELK